MPKDLRSFIHELGPSLLMVEKEVDPLNEVAELSSKASGPILFKKIKGYPSWSIIDDLVRNRKCQALAMGATEGVARHLAKVLETPGGQVRRVSTGPVKERIFIGKKANILDIPITKMSDIDAGRYIGSGMNITKDPETGNRNVACLRMQVKGPRRTGVMMVPRHTWRQFSKYEAMGRDMPMAVAIGHHPAMDIATNVTGPYEMDEYEVASRLLGEPVDLVPAETIEIDIPAYAEIVIEGYMKAGVREEEGPFGEFTCFYSGEGMNPVFDVTAITMRHDAIFRSIQATEFTEHQSLMGLPIEADIFNRVSALHGGSLEVHDVMVPSWGCAWLVVLKVTAHYDGEVKDALMSALSCNYLHPKIAIAVDEDVNIEDPADLWWAVASRVNPEKDIIMTSGNRIHPLDPSCPLISPPGEKTWQRLGGKMGIDATKPSTFRKSERTRFTRCRPMGWGKVRLEEFVKGFAKP